MHKVCRKFLPDFCSLSLACSEKFLQLTFSRKFCAARKSKLNYFFVSLVLQMLELLSFFFFFLRLRNRFNAVKKDNDFIYHEKVPTLESLPEVKGN